MPPGLGKVSWKYIGITLFLASLCLVCWNFLSFIASNAVDMPYWDEWDIAQFITGKPALRDLLLYQHVVHRIGFGLLVIKALAWFSNWSQIVEVYFIALMLLSTAFVFLLIKYRTDRYVSPPDLVIPLLFLNIFQYQNLLWGFEIVYVMPLFLLGLWTLTATAVENKAARNIIMTMLSLFSAYSSLQGLLLPVVTIVFVLAELLRDKQGSRTVAGLTAAINVSIIGSYFIGLVIPPGKPPTVLKIAAEYFASAVGTGFLFHSDNFARNLILTFVVAAFLVIGAVRFYKDRKAVNSFVGTVLIGYAILFICLLSAGRGFAQQAVQSRYITYTVIAPVGLFFVFSDLRYGRYLQALLLAVIVFNSVEYNKSIAQMVGSVMRNEKIAVEAYKSGLPSEECYKIYPLYPDRARLDSLMPEVFRFKGIPVNNLAN